MKGFTDSTKTQYACGGPVKGTKGAAKVAKVMGEFKGAKPMRKRDGGAVERGNRVQAEEAASDEKFLKANPPATNSANIPNYAVERPNPAIRPVKAAKPARGPAGAGFNRAPRVR